MSTITNRDRAAPPHAVPHAVPAPPAAPARPRTSAWRWLWQAVPTIGIVAVLGGLAAWGHSTDWTIPKFSLLVGNDVAGGEVWCTEHNVPEDECIECNTDLVPLGTDYGWCKVHGVAQCPLEHPDVAQVKVAPTVTPAMFDRANRALALRSRDENNSRCLLHRRRIQFASTDAVEKVGVDVAVVVERPVVETVIANGEVVYDQTRMANLSSRVAGTVWRVNRQVGDRVAKGDILALVDAADVGQAKSEFLQAIAQVRLQRANVERLRPLAGDGIVPGRQWLEAETAYEEARIRLQGAQQTLVNLGLPVQAEDFAALDTDEIARRIQFLGLPAAFVSSLDTQSTTSNLFPLRSSLNGVVVSREVVEGEVVDTSRTLFGVADVNRMWLVLDVRQEDAKYLSLGQPVLFRPSDSDEAEIRGSVSWISTAADDVTRTVKVRADLPNANGGLRSNTFGAGRIVLRDEPKAIVVPGEAVHWDGTCHVVFVRDKSYLQPDAPKFFHVRTVRPGVKDGETTEIIAGLLPGEVIASKNSVVLESQLLKSNLGVGCGCADDN
jgi:cobalt-zinc-cadmium efflux system membrane fusion protein